MLRSGKANICLKIVVASLVALVAMPAAAGIFGDFKKPNMKWGLLEFHPYAKVVETYDSNIYLVPKDKANGVRVGGGVVGSWITSGVLGARLALPISSMHKFDGGYEGEGRTYSKQSKVNDTFAHKGDLGYAFSGARGISAGIRDQYVNTSDPAFSELVDREQRWSNSVSGQVGYSPEGGRLSVGADVVHTTNKYVGQALGALLNRYDQAAGVKLGYRVMPKTKVFVAYHRGITHYSAGRVANHKDHHGDLGVEGDLAPKLKGQIQAGIVNRLYDSAPIATQAKSQNLFTVGTKLTWKPQERCTFNLSANRSLQESTFGNNRFYETSTVGLGVQHKFPFKLTGGLHASVGVDKYPIATSPTLGVAALNRRDDLHQQAATLDYDIQEWLRTGIGYLHRTRHAKNFTSQYSYEDHQTNISLSLTF